MLRSGGLLLVGACTVLAGCGDDQGGSNRTASRTPFSATAPVAVGLAGGNGWVATAGKDSGLWRTTDGREFDRTTDLGDLVVTSMLGLNDDIVLSGVLCDGGRDDQRCPNGGTSVIRSLTVEGNERWTVELGETESDSTGGARLAGVVGEQIVVESDDSVDWIGPDGEIERTLPGPRAPVCVLESGAVALSRSGSDQAPNDATPATAVANGEPSDVVFQLLEPQGDRWTDLPGSATTVSGTGPFGGCSNGSAEVEGDVATHVPTLRWDDAGQRWIRLPSGPDGSGDSVEAETSTTGPGNDYAFDASTGEVLRRSRSSLGMTTTAVRFDRVRDNESQGVSLLVADSGDEVFACATTSETSCELVDSNEG